MINRVNYKTGDRRCKQERVHHISFGQFSRGYNTIVVKLATVCCFNPNSRTMKIQIVFVLVILAIVW